MSNRDSLPYDIFLEHAGSGSTEKIGYMLAKQEGQIAWRPGTAPMLAPQFQTSPYDYAQIPADVFVPVGFENFTGGCGYMEWLEPIAPTVYNYSRGVDLSHGNRAYLSPLRNAHSTTLAGKPAKFLNGSDGLFMIAGDTIYEHDGVGTATWTARQDVNATLTDIVEFNGTTYVGTNDSTAYRYSTDGVTFTASSLTNNAAKYFAVRGQHSGAAVLWMVDRTGGLRANFDGANGGPQWTNLTQAGHTSETVTGLLEADDQLLVFKREGFYKAVTPNGFASERVEDVWTKGSHFTANGLKAIQWVNGKIYVPYLDKLMEYDPQTDGYRFVYPQVIGNSELNGPITALAFDGDWIYTAQKNAAGNTYILKIKPYDNGHVEAHTFIYLGANDCDAMEVVEAGLVHASNPVLLIGYGATSVSHYILPRSGYRPEDDSNYRFDTTTGYIYGPWINIGTKTYTKFLNAGTVLAASATAARTVALSYEADDSGSTTAIATASQNGVSSANVSSPPEFNRIRYYGALATNANTASPVLLGFLFAITPNPVRKRMWSFDVVVGNNLQRRGGGISEWQGNKLEDHLFSGLSEQVTLYDRRGRDFLTRIRDIQNMTSRPKTEGDEDYYTVTCVEITETTTLSGIFIWGTSSYNSNSVWGP